LIIWFVSLRYLCSLPEIYPGMETQGVLWVKDLTAPDPYYVLPVLTALMNFYNIITNTNAN